MRIFRARTEGASLDTVPEVKYSVKPSCDGRANKSIAQRGIMGFEPAPVAAPTVTAWKNPRKQYMCSHCEGEVPKKGHICPMKVAKKTGKNPPKRKSSTVRAAVKKARK